nr:GIY-YIG nuclease family protein [Turicibacter sp.]
MFRQFIDEERGELIYVGETEESATRLLSHDKQKDFWDHAYFFFSRTHQLNKADIKFLEAKIYQMIRESGRYKLANSNIPKESYVHDIRQSELMDILETIEFILGGAFNLFPFKKINIPLEVGETKDKINRLKHRLVELEREIFYMNQKGADAKGYLIGEGKKFVVLKGSKTLLIEKEATCFKTLSAAASLERLKNQEILQEMNGYYQFTENYIFNSPSGASDLIYLS